MQCFAAWAPIWSAKLRSKRVGGSLARGLQKPAQQYQQLMCGSVLFFHLATRGASVSRTPYLTGIRRPAAGATALRFAEVGPRVGRWRSSAGGDWSGPFFSPDNRDGCDLGTAGRCSIRKVAPGSVIGTAHFAFTGHQIRIARSGAALP